MLGAGACIYRDVGTMVLCCVALGVVDRGQGWGIMDTAC